MCNIDVALKDESHDSGACFVVECPDGSEHEIFYRGWFDNRPLEVMDDMVAKIKGEWKGITAYWRHPLDGWVCVGGRRKA